MAIEGVPHRKMLKLTVRVRARDEHGGRLIPDLLLSLYKSHGVSGATVVQGVRGYGKHGVSRVDVLGLSMNVPVIVETVDDEEKIRKMLPEVKAIVGPNGLTTVEPVDVV